MFAEEAQFMSDLYSISPELTCQCDEVHICQQCREEVEATSIIPQNHTKEVKPKTDKHE